MNESYDLIVIGAGPAGSAAAITAARAGMSVLLLERGRFPRHKVCGEFISAESLSLLRWLLGETNPDLVRNSLVLTEGRLLIDGRTLRVPINPPAASIARYDLDLALWNAAQQAGARVLSQTVVQTIGGEGPFLARTSAGDFQARAVINASGRWSNLNRAALPLSNSGWLGIKTHMRGETDSTVDLYFFAGGYCGVQPVRGAGGEPLINVCALLKPGVSDGLNEVLARHPILYSRSRAWRPAFAPLSTFPVIFQEPRPVSDCVINVGDAAGFVDPFVGDGIALAMRGGNLAALSLLRFVREDCTLASALRTYAKNYRVQLRPVYRSSSLLRKLVGLPRTLRAPLLAVAENSSRVTNYFMQATRSRSVFAGL